MKQNALSQWIPFGFSVALSAISLVTFLATGGSGAWIPAFICFVPMTFYFSAVSQNQARAQIEALEARIRQLEAESQSALSSTTNLAPMGSVAEPMVVAHTRG